ncbi:MAG: hypothetical protein R3B13_31180 [Polyangiaceae bacterium]
MTSQSSTVPLRWLTLAITMLVTSLGLGGCMLFGGLHADAIAHTAERPANVAVYLSVRDGKDPVTDLAADNFHLSENGQPLGSGDTNLTLLDRRAVAEHRVLLLVDISTAKDAGARRQLARGVAGFVESVKKQQAVTLFAFDGRAEPIFVAEYPQGDGEKVEQVQALEAQTPQDPSRNLHGAAMHAIKQLDARLLSAKKPIRIGTLVIFAAGPDLAARVTREEVEEKIRNSPHHVLTVIVANEEQDADLGDLAKDGLHRAPSVQMAGIGLDEAARRVNALEQQYYLLSYCSPARAGARRLTIDVKRTTLEGSEQSASANVDFDATGFGPGCDSSRVPRFASGTTPVPVQGEDPDKPEGTAPKDPGPQKPSGDKPPAKDPDEAAPPPDLPGYAPLPGK